LKKRIFVRVLDISLRGNLYTPPLRDTGADGADASVRNSKARTAKPAGLLETGNRREGFVCRATGANGSLLIDIVNERKRNADGVCPCGFRVTGDEEANV
jgi:hypothetical protein